jgi:hypothetical protein
MEASSTDEESPMKKPTVTWVWLSGLAAIIAGLIVVATGIGLMLGLGGVPGAPRVTLRFWIGPPTTQEVGHESRRT